MQRKPSAWHVRPPSHALTCPPNGCPKFLAVPSNPTPKPSYLLTNLPTTWLQAPLGPWHLLLCSSSALSFVVSPQLSAPLQSFVSPLQGLSLYRQPLAPTRMCLISEPGILVQWQGPSRCLKMSPYPSTYWISESWCILSRGGSVRTF